MTFETIKKTSAPEMVAEQILKRIEKGELGPGSCLPPQRDLARLLGVGRSSIREAINALVVMGYLEVIQGKGTFVRPNVPASDPTLQKLDAALKAGSIFELMEARQLLESHAAALAAQRAEKFHLQKLKAAVRRLAEAGPPYADFLRADIAFHDAVAEATGNAVICEMTKLILGKLVEYHSQLQTRRLSAQYKRTSISSAQRVVQSIENQDEDKASEWMRIHLNAITEELKHIIP